MLGRDITVWGRLTDEDLRDIADVRVHIELKVHVSTTERDINRVALDHFEIIDTMLIAQESLDDQAEVVAKVVRGYQ